VDGIRTRTRAHHAAYRIDYAIHQRALDFGQDGSKDDACLSDQRGFNDRRMVRGTRYNISRLFCVFIKNLRGRNEGPFTDLRQSALHVVAVASFRSERLLVLSYFTGTAKTRKTTHQDKLMKPVVYIFHFYSVYKMEREK
jgi:hypothetical protein